MRLFNVLGNYFKQNTTESELRQEPLYQLAERIFNNCLRENSNAGNFNDTSGVELLLKPENKQAHITIAVLMTLLYMKINSDTICHYITVLPDDGCLFRIKETNRNDRLLTLQVPKWQGQTLTHEDRYVPYQYNRHTREMVCADTEIALSDKMGRAFYLVIHAIGKNRARIELRDAKHNSLGMIRFDMGEGKGGAVLRAPFYVPLQHRLYRIAAADMSFHVNAYVQATDFTSVKRSYQAPIAEYEAIITKLLSLPSDELDSQVEQFCALIDDKSTGCMDGRLSAAMSYFRDYLYPQQSDTTAQQAHDTDTQVLFRTFSDKLYKDVKGNDGNSSREMLDEDVEADHALFMQAFIDTVKMGSKVKLQNQQVVTVSNQTLELLFKELMTLTGVDSDKQDEIWDNHAPSAAAATGGAAAGAIGATSNQRDNRPKTNAVVTTGHDSEYDDDDDYLDPATTQAPQQPTARSNNSTSTHQDTKPTTTTVWTGDDDDDAAATTAAHQPPTHNAAYINDSTDSDGDDDYHATSSYNDGQTYSYASPTANRNGFFAAGAAGAAPQHQPQPQPPMPTAAAAAAPHKPQPPQQITEQNIRYWLGRLDPIRASHIQSIQWPARRPLQISCASQEDAVFFQQALHGQTGDNYATLHRNILKLQKRDLNRIATKFNSYSEQEVCQWLKRMNPELQINPNQIQFSNGQLHITNLQPNQVKMLSAYFTKYFPDIDYLSTDSSFTVTDDMDMWYICDSFVNQQLCSDYRDTAHYCLQQLSPTFASQSRPTPSIVQRTSDGIEKICIVLKRSPQIDKIIEEFKRSIRQSRKAGELVEPANANPMHVKQSDCNEIWIPTENMMLLRELCQKIEGGYNPHQSSSIFDRVSNLTTSLRLG